MEELIYFHFLVDCNKKSQESQRKEKECRLEPLQKKSLQRCQEIGLLARTSLVCTYKFKKKRFSIYLSILIYIYILSVRLHSIIDRANKFETSIKCLLGNSKKNNKKNWNLALSYLNLIRNSGKTIVPMVEEFKSIYSLFFGYL